MDDATTVVDTYLAMWNEPDPGRRAELIRRAWAPGARYVDPALQAEGHEAIGAMVGEVHARFPGHRFRRTSAIDRHHDQLRFSWQLAAGDGTVAVAGIDVAEVADDGRLGRVTGFFGELADEVAA